MSKIINFNELKEKKMKKKHIIYLLFFIILLYILYSIYLIAKTPNDIFIVENGVLTLEESANGYIIRDETVLKGENYKNGITPIVSEGERAAKGQNIFRYNNSNEEQIKSKIEEINLKVQEALSKENTVLPADVRNLDKQIDDKIQYLNKFTDIHTISEYKKEIEEIINKKAKIAGQLSPRGSYIQELTKQKEEYEKELTEGSEYITSPIAGVVSYRVDGLEEILKASDFSNFTEERLEKLEVKTGKIISTSNENGKVIDNFGCYLGTFLNSDAAQKAEIGQNVIITLSSGYEIKAEISYIAKQENNKVLIVFNLKTLTGELIEYRKISFNITWWSSSGLKVPNTSIIEDEQANKYVVRRKAGEDKKILVKVLKKNDKYSIISTYKQEELTALGINPEQYTKISQYDKILLYPDINKVTQ